MQGLLRERGLQGSQASGVAKHGLSSCDSRLSSCLWAQLLNVLLDLPGSRIEPVSLGFAGRFFTTEPPGKPLKSFLMVVIELPDVQ